MNKKQQIRTITEIAIFVAIALVLDVIAGLFSPFKYGGSISPAMLPIFVIAYRRGLKNGLFAGFIFGVLQSIVAEMLGYGVFAFIIDEGWWKFIVMFLLDYVIAFTVLGFAAVFKEPMHHQKSFILGISLASFLRYLSHALSGVLIWGDYAIMAGFNPYLYSFVIYNLPYMITSYLLCLVIGLILFRRKLLAFNL